MKKPINAMLAGFNEIVPLDAIRVFSVDGEAENCAHSFAGYSSSWCACVCARVCVLSQSSNYC